VSVGEGNHGSKPNTIENNWFINEYPVIHSSGGGSEEIIGKIGDKPPLVHLKNLVLSVVERLDLVP
jgi:hypothetical protein